MPKLKTVKAVAKRVRITKNKKMKIRAGGQDHFNARESGKTTKGKRRDITLSNVNKSNIKKLLPYS